MTGGWRLWLRWSRRDLRARWLLVATIALVIALGTGLATGLGSLERWRVASNDASFGLLRSHDLRFTLAEGARADEGAMRRSLAAMSHPEWVEASQERLVLPTQVDASGDGRTVLTPGRILGMPVSGPQTEVDRLYVDAGRGFAPGDANRPVAVVETGYAESHGLPSEGTLRVAGGAELRYVGHGVIPEYFLVITPGTGFGTEGGFGVLFVPLATAQAITGRPGAVNELVVRLAPGVDPDRAGQEIAAAIEEGPVGLGTTVTRLDEEDTHRLLYRDAENDQRLLTVFALLVLAAATLGAFTLMSRVVDAQRREIGIGMALGVSGRALALRPVLMGTQVALLGAAFGVGVGLGIGELMRLVLEGFFPLPVVETPFEVGTFAQWAAVGFLLPLAASVYPVVRAVRVPPIEAIQVSARSATAGLAPALRRLRLPGGALSQMAIRGALRAPRRTLLTSLGIAAAITMVVALGGTISSFAATIDRAEEEIAGPSPSRLEVDLDGFQPATSPAVSGVISDPAIARAETTITVTGAMRSQTATVEAIVEIVDPESDTWRPTVTDGTFTRGDGGILIAEEAARDLGVSVGHTIALVHPRRIPGVGVTLAQTEFRVSGTHPNPLRFLAFLDSGKAEVMGLTGLANTMWAIPTPGVSRDQAVRALFGAPGVVSIEGSTEAAEAVRERMNEFQEILQIAEGVVLLLGLLIAFNATSISGEERRREHATLMAFGVPVRGVLRVAIVESVTVGIVATIIGVAAGYGVLSWIMQSLISETLPEIGPVISVGTATYVTAIVAGVVAVGLAPLLTRRRVARLDLPSTLRVVE